MNVVSAAEMHDAVKASFVRCDCVIMAAAVCDYRPVRKQNYKISKGAGNMLLELERTSDILAGLAQAKTNQILIGFAVQDRAAKRLARAKLRDKKLDAIVLNGPSAFGADRMAVAILTREGGWEDLGVVRKSVLATRIVRLAEELRADQQAR